MSILKPSNSFDKFKRRFVAQKEFTDRELPRETFLRNIEELTADQSSNEENLRVLVYYGIGGIGKTSLKSELKSKVLGNSIQDSIALEVDFREIRSRECPNGLLDLYNSLKQNPKYSKIIFPHFEFAYAMYFKKKNPEIVYNEKEDNILKFVDLGLKVFGIVSIADFGLTTFLTKEGINRAYSKYKNLKLNNEMKEHLSDFSNFSLTEMEDYLVLFFAHDLKKYLKKVNDVKIVVFIDTFEALLEIETQELKKLAKTEWVRELILNLPNVLFVITGRDKISWGNEWNEVLDQHLISELTPEYTIQFLENCGIEELEIRNKIVEISSGHPYYLDLSVDTYFSIKNDDRNPKPEDFGTKKEDILRRFITNLNNTEVELLKVMSIPNYYNIYIFEFLIEQFRIPYPVTQFESFNQYSFVNHNEILQRYTLHQLMRMGMDEHISSSLKEQANEKLLTFFEAKYNLDKKYYLFECVYHRLRTKDFGSFFEWLNGSKIEFLKYLQLFGDTVLLSNVFEQIRHKFEINQFSIELFNIYEDIVHLSGNYKESVNLAENFLGRYSKDEILLNKKLIKLSYRISHHKMFYVNADTLMNELLNLRNEVSKDQFFDEYCEITYMLGGGVGFLTGKLDDCKQHLDYLIELINSQETLSKDLQNIYTRACRKIVDYYRVTGETRRAEEYALKYLDLDNLNRYQIYLLCSYADIQRELGNYEASINHFEKVVKETKVLGIKGWLAHAYLSLANVNLDMNRIAEARNYLDKAAKVYRDLDHKWGIINTNILNSRVLLVEGGNGFLDLLDETFSIAEQFGYRYEIELINKIRDTKQIGVQRLLYV